MDDGVVWSYIQESVMFLMTYKSGGDICRQQTKDQHPKTVYIQQNKFVINLEQSDTGHVGG